MLKSLYIDIDSGEARNALGGAIRGRMKLFQRDLVPFRIAFIQNGVNITSATLDAGAAALKLAIKARPGATQLLALGTIYSLVANEARVSLSLNTVEMADFFTSEVPAENNETTCYLEVEVTNLGGTERVTYYQGACIVGREVNNSGENPPIPGVEASLYVKLADIGGLVQAYDAELQALAGLTSAADTLPYFTGGGTAALATFTGFARTLLDDANAAAARTTLGAQAELGYTPENLANKGAASGYCDLDSNQKVPLARLPDSILGQVTYAGTWNATTNTPALVDPPAASTMGDYYVVSVAGTQFTISFQIGDWIISNGAAWQKVDNTDAVSSVFGRTGPVTASGGDYTATQITTTPAGAIAATNVQAALNELDTDKEPVISAGTSAQYWRGDKTWQALDRNAVGLGNVDNTSDATRNTATATLTNKTISGTSNTLSGIGNAALTNSAITIAGTATALGGSITQDTITGLASTGLVKRTAANTLGIAAAGTDYLPGYSGLTTNGILQATSGTAITATLTPSGLTSIGVNSITAAAASDLTLTAGSGNQSLHLGSTGTGITFFDLPFSKAATADINGPIIKTSEVYGSALVLYTQLHADAAVANRFGVIAAYDQTTSAGVPLKLNPYGGLVLVPSLETSGYLRSTAGGVPAAGQGLELSYGNVANTASILAYDRTGAAYKNINLDGLGVAINSGSGGNVGIKTTAANGIALNVTNDPGYSGGGSVGISSVPIWSSTSLTTIGATYDSYFSLNGSATVPEIKSYRANGGSLGTATLTNYKGFSIEGWPAAANVYGFVGGISSGTGRWNLYMGGTAANYLGGTLQVAATTASTSTTTGALTVAGGMGIAGGIYAGAPVSVVSAANSNVTVDTNAGFDRFIYCKTGGVARWGFGAIGNTESGSNSGSDLAFRNFNDAGSLLGTYTSIARATGDWNIRSTTASTSTTTGSIVTLGGIGVGGAINAGGASAITYSSGAANPVAFAVAPTFTNPVASFAVGAAFSPIGTQSHSGAWLVGQQISLTLNAGSTSAALVGSYYGSINASASTVANAYGLFFNGISGATNNYLLYNAGAGKVVVGDTTTATSPTVGAVVIGNGVSATTVAVGGGQIRAGDSIVANSFLVAGTSSGRIGYQTTTGAGGAVTQATSRTTGVTLNLPTGAITLVSAAGSTAWQTFTVTNSAVAATDVPRVVQKSGADKYLLSVTAVAAGSFDITFATTGGTTTEQPVFNFVVIKGSTN